MRNFSVFILFFILACPAWASAQQATIENNTHQNITALYISNADGWGADILGGTALASGDSVQHTFDKAAMYDLKAVFDDGKEQPYYAIDVSKFSHVRLGTNGVDLAP